MSELARRRSCVVLGSYAPSLILFRGPLIAELVRRGYRVVAMAPEIGGDIRDQLLAIGAEPQDVPMVNNSLNPLEMLATLKRLQAAFAELRPDAVIAYTIKPVTLGVLAARKAGVPTVVALVTGLGFAFTEGGGLKRRLSRIAASLLYRLALRRSSLAVFQNPDDLGFFRDSGILPEGANIALVNGSGIDLERFRQAPLPREPKFLMIARLLGDKGLREYGTAAAALKRKYPQAVFELVGYFDQSPDSISSEELSAMVGGGVEFLGRMDDVRPAIERASVYVLPSYREGTPRSVLEAMAMGRPIVTTDAPGCRETVEHGANGYLVPPRNSEALAAAMERFILSPETMSEMGACSRRIAEQKFDVHRVNDALLAAAGL
jgi:glycosyltransferase involved in cell wall biosynthesis